MSVPQPTANAEPGPPTPGEEGVAAETPSARPRRRAGVAGAAVGDLLVRLEAQVFRAQPTAQLQVTRTDEVTARTSDGPLAVAFPPQPAPPGARPLSRDGDADESLSDLDTDVPAGEA
jgi:hypothetical protein